MFQDDSNRFQNYRFVVLLVTKVDRDLLMTLISTFWSAFSKDSFGLFEAVSGEKHGYKVK